MNMRQAALAFAGVVTLAGCGGNGKGNGPSGGWTKLEVLAGQIGAGAGIADGAAKSARFDFLQGLHTASDGSVYIVDSANNTIRKLASGQVTTIAGSPFAYGHLDGVGSAASFNFPTDITDDGAGNLYVADAGSHSIRKIVAATGAVSTLAGGATGSVDGIGSAAGFTFPSGIVFDGGSLYVADESVVRKIDLATTAVTTLAGDPTQSVAVGVDGVGTAALFSSLWGIATDHAGDLFLTDLSASQVRQLVIASADVTTIAGNGTYGYQDGAGAQALFNFPQGIVSDGAGSLYVADVDNNAVRKIVLAGSVVSTLAGAPTLGAVDGGGAAARFYQPSGLDFAGGNLLVADAMNNDVREIQLSTGSVTTVAGAPGHYGYVDGSGTSARFDAPGSISADASGNVYVADEQNEVIRAISPAGVVTTVAGSPGLSGKDDGVGAAARFQLPIAVVPDDQGHLYVADLSSSNIRKIDLTTKAVTTIAGLGYSSERDGIGTLAGFDLPTSLALDGQGHLFVGDSDGKTIRQLDLATGAVTTLAGVANTSGSADGVGTAATFTSPAGLAFDGAALYVTDGATVRKIDVASATVSTIAGTAGQHGVADGVGAAARFQYASAVTLSTDKSALYIADGTNSLVRKLTLATGAVTTVVGVAQKPGVKTGALPAGLNLPYGLAALPDGHLAIADLNENAILVVE